ncbi:hypothetical protein [Mesorhizobium sp. WSM3862]|uniref:hypothetical protein n=1 Tax=Mesorhizobium sp. WSM3862 TaxID=632858 RepID=UPI000BAEB9F3|nr:hypothetical protein [Mesorhizobium sp. WSM3862]PBB96804.1 hypothetical protein CK224_21280 [Mesorhizobium sp. WSM3862]
MANLEVTGIKEDTPAILTLTIDTYGPATAELAGELLVDISRAYRAFTRRLYGPRVDSRLVVDRIRVSSIIADLIAVASALETLWDQRELLGAFAAHLSDAAGILTGKALAKSLESVPRETQAFFKRVSSDITAHKIKGTTIQINGDVNAPITINIQQPEAQDIKKTLKARKRKLKKPGDQGGDSTKLPMWDDLLQSGPKMLVPRPSGLPVAADGLTYAGGGGKLTTFFVDGRWYGRLEHGSGTLLPLFADSFWLECKPVDGQEYLWQGVVVSDPRGSPAAVRVTSLRAI